MSETVSEVTHQGFFSRLMESIKGVLFGLLLFVVAFPCLFWNETRAVNDWQTLQSGRGAVVSVDAESVDPDNEGRLVHLSGRATTDETLDDVQFGVSESVLKLSRDVEMFQWKENQKKKKRKKLGGGEETVTEYSYEKVWSSSLIKSGSFKKASEHANPSSMAYSAESFTAKSVTVGGFDLSAGLIGQISAWEDLEITSDTLAAAPDGIRGRLQVADGGYYIGADPSTPAIGDMRVSFEVVRPTVVTVVAGQDNNMLDSWESPLGTGSLSMLEVGSLESDEMFEAAESRSVALTWGLRIGGFFAMFMGITMILRPFTVVGDIIPFVGSFLRLGAGILGCFMASILSLGTIALGWLFARPILGAVLCSMTILLFVGLVVLAVTLGRSRLKAAQDAAATPA